MTKKYCLDTSGFSTPLEQMPQDVHQTLWRHVTDVLTTGKIATTAEVLEELTRLADPVGTCLTANPGLVLLEVADGSWDWEQYLLHNVRMQKAYVKHISEYNGGRKDTICLNDLTVIALAKTLELPVISSERPVVIQANSRKRKIPNICTAEGVRHLSFTDFLRIEKIRI